MAIHESTVTQSSSGFSKEIDAGSMHMALDVLQKFQYQYPQKSTIRELAANAVDSIKEREIAKLIISGKAKEEDYYIRRDEAEFKDSNFNASYFDPKWLSNKKEVEIIYEEGDGVNKKDRLRIIDEGVGLGGSRLELYFKLNASSKRNSKSAIGKWGLGAKVGLSTGVDSYRVITKHNGCKFMFDVYSHKVDSVVEKFAKDGSLNPHVLMNDGKYLAYYESTTDKNGTEIVVETKKHHRAQYTDAVRSQLLYFDNVNYSIIRESGHKEHVTVKAGIIYNDDDIILSDNNQYSKPHIIINNVCYGYIDFLELELENKNGNIGIKMEAEDVDISPSREQVIWGDKTRASVTSKFNKVVDIASLEVEKQLNEKDFIKWLGKCSAVLSSYDTTSILGRLSRVVDRSALKPTYSLDKSIKFKLPSEMLGDINARTVHKKSVFNYKTGKNNEVVERDELSAWNIVQKYDVYYTTDKASNLKDRYLLSAKERFLLLTVPEKITEEEFREKRKLIATDVVDKAWDTYLKNWDYSTKVLELIKQSPLSFDYDTVVVPDDFKNKIEEAETTDAEAVVVAEMTPAEKRKLDERTVLYYPQKSGYVKSKQVTDPNDPTKNIVKNIYHDWIKTEPKISEVLAWEGNVIYCYGDEDEGLLNIAWLLEPQFKNFFTDDVKLVRVSKGIKKHFKNHTHISEFFKNVSGTTLSMSNLLVKWYTGKRIHDELNKINFLNNFSMFNQEIFDKYQELRLYQAANYVDMSSKYNQNLLGCSQAAFDSICAFADKAAELQIFISEHEGKDEDIKEKAKEILGAELTGSLGIDLEQYKKLVEVTEYAQPLKNIFNHVAPLVATNGKIDYSLETEIKEIMRNKGYDN